MARQSMLKSFLSEILVCVRARNGQKITDLIQLDFGSIPPERQKPYADLNSELNSKYPRENDTALTQICKTALPQDELGSFHASFAECVIQYFRYLRDFTSANNLQKAQKIRQLTSQCITALGDSNYGIIMIPIVLSFSRVLGMIASNLDCNPDLTQYSSSSNNTASTASDGSGRGSKVSFVETTANVLRDAFIKCLAGSPGSPRTSRPTSDDKRYGIYLTVNSCLKLLWQCRKLRNAEQMFLSIDAQSPLLSFYPTAQRVTYLYYLGRYHFANNHFYRAQLTLQAAYNQCHRDAIKQRRSIVIYLTASNICLGRFPSAQLLARAECAGLSGHFVPLCQLIKSGDIGALETFFDLSRNATNSRWLLQKRLLLQLRNRCEVLTWRSLIRRVFILTGFKGEDKKIPFLRLNAVRAAARWSLSRRGVSPGAATGFTTTSSGPSDYVDPDFADLESAIAETGFDVSTGAYHDEPINHNPGANNTGQFSNDEQAPTSYEVESVFLSLIQQGLLRGFVLHNPQNPRFAIPGSQAAGGPIPRAFPSVWHVITSKAAETDDEGVPGWVRRETLPATGTMRTGAANLGGVVRLSGARPVGLGS